MEKREIIGKFVVHWNILLRILDLICTVACKIWIKRSLPLTVLFSRIVFSPIFSEVFFHFDFSLNWLRNIFDIFFSPFIFKKFTVLWFSREMSVRPGYPAPGPPPPQGYPGPPTRPYGPPPTGYPGYNGPPMSGTGGGPPGPRPMAPGPPGGPQMVSLPQRQGTKNQDKNPLL